MSLPITITETLKADLDLTISSAKPVSGGSINEAFRVESDRGSFFLKMNRSAPAGFFEKEAEGLKLLKSADTGLRVPEVLLSAEATDNRPAFLLMEFIEEGRSGDSFDFGVELAELHMHGADRFGLETDNYIGSLPQRNRQHDDWSAFFAEERIGPQLRMAVDSGKLAGSTNKNFRRMAARLDDIFPFTDPSLLHGDFWGGNYLFDSDGRAVLIDPAVYYGHPEADLAFTKLFGGFAGAFYSGYDSVSPLEPEFHDRVPVYNLYPLLVHVNLFGGHYISQARSILEQF